MFGKKKKNKRFLDAVIVNDQRESVESLRKKAKHANTKFWGLAVSMGMVSSLVLPYMSMAAVAPKSTNVFTGQVVPGYSMGGVTLAAYGVDVNSWGNIGSASKVVGSNYGVWSGKRLESAQGNVTKTSNLENDEENLSNVDRAAGWQGITGRMAYTQSNPDGIDSENVSNQYDSVAPYRTLSDYNYWDKRMLESNGAASASVNVSLFADFIIVSLDTENSIACVLDGPDQVNSDGSAMLMDEQKPGKNTQGKTSATPYYIPISELMNAYGIMTSQEASISELMCKIRDGGANKFYQIVTSIPSLLEGTTYTSLNNPSLNEESNAFNPYPYSMVFSMSTDNGELVSSIYTNSEAYVYFSPSSVYNQYIALRTEYERIRNNAESSLEKGKQEPEMVFRLGYYLAEMAILEAYLDEALPQDMTRGYVGPTECTDLNGSDNKTAGNGEAQKFTTASTPEELNQVSYVSLMYDFSHNMSGTQWDISGREWRQTETDAIMDTLSTFGYSLKKDNSKKPSGVGVMKGIDAASNLGRPTLFGVYTRSTDWGDSGSIPAYSATRELAGLYTPTYYPIQQHKMPDSEKVYRFQVLSAIPYETLLEYIKQKGFEEGVTFSFGSSDTEGEASGLENFNSLTVTQAKDKLSGLAYQYEHEEEVAVETLKSLSALSSEGEGLESKLSVFGGSTSEDDAIAKRVDAALIGYNSSTMNSDNVHDLFDVVRGTKLLKYETWIRFYNPIKSSGGDNDLFLTRVSPALTTYFPALLVNGYTPAGGAEIDSSLTPYSASFDYFSIPSFAPCFAAHTADTSYYGILNYELRPFYTSKFIKTLSKSANVPAVEAKEAAQEQLDQLKQEQQDEAAITNKNLACLYVLGKRVAYVRTVEEMMNTDVFISKEEYKSVLEQMIFNQDAYKAAKEKIANTTSTSGKHSSGYDNAMNIVKNPTFVVNKLNGVPIKEQWDNIFQESFPDTIKLHYHDERGGDKTDGDAGIAYLNAATFSIDAGSWVDRDYFASRTGMSSNDLNKTQTSSGVAEDHDLQPFGCIHRDHDFSPWDHGTESRQLMIVKDDSCSKDCTNAQDEHYWISASIFFTAVYNRKFNALLGSNGTYYWEEWENIFKMMKNDGLEPEAADEIAYNANEKGKYNTRFATDWTDKAAQLAGISIKDCDTTSELIQICLAQMDKASDEIAKDMINLIKDYNMLTKTMPSKMQNCLAWADYQNSSDSEAQYQVDPSNANVIINVGDGQNGQSAPAPEHIRSKAEAEALALQVTPAQDGNGFTVTNQNATDENGLGLEGRLERGVEGSTWTSTVHPALYTMTATIARCSSMSSQTGTVFPYSGFYNGRLQSGTDKYAVMQAHVIDYTSIASGIAGDLSTRTRAQVVALVEPQYASIDSFTDILNIIGAFFGEAGTAMVQGASTMFASVMFPSDQESEFTTTSPSANAASSTMSYMMHDGSTMNRTPASLATFNPNTGKLEYGTVINNTSSNYVVSNSITSANAAGNSGMALMAGDTVLGPLAGVYKIVQTFGLTFVMLFIGFIAFRNFFAYTSGKPGEMLRAQMQLKTVLWRSIVAVFMIGLPPLGGTGFEGGNFIVLEVLSNVMGFIESIFIGDNGSAIMSIFTNVNLFESFGINFFAWLLFFICCAIIALCFLVGTLLVWLLNMFLLVFFLLGPLVWAFYVWPYSDTTTGRDTEGKTGWKQYVNLGFLSGGAVGNLMPKGHIRNFVVFSLIGVAWGLLFWFVAQIFVIGSGVSYTDSNSASAATLMASASGYSTASMAISSATAGIDLFGIPTGMGAEIRLLITTVVCVICFLLMGYLLLKAFVNQMRYTRGLGSQLGQGILNGIQKADEKINGVIGANGERVGGLKNKVAAAADAAKIMKHGSLADADKNKKLKKASKMLSKGNLDPKALPDDMKKFLKEEGLADNLDTDEGRKKALAGLTKKQAEQKERKKEAQKALRDGLTKESYIDPKTGEHKLRSKGLLANAATAAKMAQNFGKAADNGNFLDAFAQTANALNAGAIDRDCDALKKEVKALESAQLAADKLLEDGADVDATLKGLDEDTFKKLCEAGVAEEKKDDKGKVTRALTKDGAFKAKSLSDGLERKIEENKKKILAKDNEKKNFSDELKRLGLAKDSSIQECTKVLKAGYDNQRAQAIIEEHDFKGDGTMTAHQQAIEYMKGGEYTRKIDNQEAAAETAARLLDFDPKNLDAEQRRAVEKYVAGASSMEALCGISRLRSPEDKQKALSSSIQGIVDAIDTNAITSPSARMDAVRMACGAPVPSLVEQPAIMAAVANGTATAYQYQQYAAMQANNIVNGRPLTKLPDSSHAAVLAAQGIDESLADVSAMQVAKTRIANGNNGKPADLGMIGKFASNDSMAQGVAQAIMEEAQAGGALAAYNPETIQRMASMASRLVDPSKSAEENLAALSNLSSVNASFQEFAIDTPEGKAANTGFAIRARAQEVLAEEQAQLAECQKLKAEAKQRMEYLHANPKEDPNWEAEFQKAQADLKAANVMAAEQENAVNRAQQHLDERIAETAEQCGGFESLADYKREMASAVAMCVLGGATTSAMRGYSASVAADNEISSKIYASGEVGALYAERLAASVADPAIRTFIESNYVDGMSMDDFERHLMANLPVGDPMAGYEVQNAVNLTKSEFAHSDEALNAMSEFAPMLSDEQIASYKLNVTADSAAVGDVAAYVKRDDISIRAENPVIAGYFDNMKDAGELSDVELTPEFFTAVKNLSNGRTIEDVAAKCDAAGLDDASKKRAIGVYQAADKLMANMYEHGDGDALYGDVKAQRQRARMSYNMEGKGKSSSARRAASSEGRAQIPQQLPSRNSRLNGGSPRGGMRRNR